MNPVTLWWKAIRPATLMAGGVPVVVATALAHGHEKFDWWVAVLCLLGALLIQIGTNFANDYYDFIKGADTEERLGPQRATQQGWVRPVQMKRATYVALGLALLVGLVLIWRGGWPIALLGCASLLLAVGYTGGPFPLAYLGLGDLFVLAFFGLGATAGTYWLLTFSLPSCVWFAGFALGALATAILVVNNLRDRHTDAVAGKKTLAVRWGSRAARIEYVALVVSAYGAVVAGVVEGALPDTALWVFACLPQAAICSWHVLWRDGRELNPLLGATARLETVFGLILAMAVI